MQTKNLGIGALAGLAGGVVFGILMHAMDMIGMVGGLVGAEGVAAGWAVHLVNSAIIGAVFGLLAARFRGAGSLVGVGVAYGIAWWVLGALLIMPLWMGMPALEVGAMQFYSLAGHMMYGAVTGLAWFGLVKRTAQEPVSVS
jgi:uncharacterized membrane protein YagU involved in acid resistance